MIKAIILDFDGVIIESVDIKTQAFEEMFKGQPDIVGPFIEYHLRNNGKSRFDKFEWLYKTLFKKPLSEDERTSLGNRFSKLIFQKVVECPYIEGALEFLVELYTKVPLYVASITPQAELEAIIDKRYLRKYFKGVIGTTGKKSQIINKILDIEKINPQNVIFIGDTMEDYLASRETGVEFVARLNKESFQGLDVQKFVNLREIENWLILRMNKDV